MFLRFNLGEQVIENLDQWQNLLKSAETNLAELKNTVRGYKRLFYISGDLHSSDFYGRRLCEVNTEIYRRTELAKRAA